MLNKTEKQRNYSASSLDYTVDYADKNQKKMAATEMYKHVL